MSNRLFTAALISITAVLLFFFLILVVCLFTEFITTESVKPFDYREVLFAIRLSVYTSSVAAVIAVIIGIPVAYFISRHEFAGRDLVDTVLDLPVFLSPIALGALLMIFFNSPPGRWMEQLIGPVVFEVRAIIVAQFFVIIGLGIRLLKNTFQHIDPEYEHISRVLGADKFQTFRMIVLPLSRKGLITAFLLVWARAIGEFGATLVLAGATTMKTETIPIGIFLGFESADIHSAAVFILVLIGVSSLILLITRKVLRGT